MKHLSPLIAPSLLGADFLNLQQEISFITKAGANWLHIDVMDGHFVPNLAFGIENVRQIKQFTTLPLDVHLMVDCLDNVLEQFIEIGVNYLTIHPEATYHPYRCLQKIRNSSIGAGIAINPGTSLEMIYPVIEQVDIALIMTVNPGFGGQKFIHHMLPKIQELRNFIDREGLSVKIEVDGGINEETAPLVINAGADILVAGNYLFQKTNNLSSLIETYIERIKSLQG